MSLLDEAENAPPQKCIRMLVVGTAQVGKTALVRRFISGRFEETYTPTIEDFHRKVYRVRGEYFKLDIIDMSGIWINPAMRRLNILAGDIFVIMYSIENRQSFEEAKRLKEEILSTIHTNSHSVAKWKRCKLVPIFVVGNKADLYERRAVENHESRHAFDSCKSVISSSEVSCKEGWKTDDVFVQIFALARLPIEMAPALHRKVHYSYVYDRHDAYEINEDEDSGNMESTVSHYVPPRASTNSAVSRRAIGSRRRAIEAYGAYVPNAIRPTIQQDLAALQAVDNTEKFNRPSRISMHYLQEYPDYSLGSSKNRSSCIII